MNKSHLSKEYQTKKADYNRLGKNVVEALQTFLIEENISFLDVYYRVKKFDSFLEKISRKKYTKAFDEIEDICGIRIICYYASDIQRIGTLINNEFSVIAEEDKSELLGLREFAYRSRHYVVKINNSWLASPNYRRLDNLKCEIQVRTILMHAWAEIEHKLNYKSTAQVPNKFQRKLFRLSAKFEEADEQFEELRDGIEDYISLLSSKIESSKKFNLSQDFNIESFRLFIKYHFPNKPFDEDQVEMLFNNLSKANLGFKTIDNVVQKMKPYYKEILEDIGKSGYERRSTECDIFLWVSMDVFDNKEFNIARGELASSFETVVKKWRKKTKNMW